ncbi:hypothetical protein Bbelb_318250 [Branchiostoma belcheri]|nr:hypothetical protein Bbelb_318250 [Branchiostoma belcheri]
MSGSRRTYRTLPLDVPHSPAERIALSRWTYRTLPQNVPHSPAGRTALSRWTYRTLPLDVPHSPAERTALSRWTYRTLPQNVSHSPGGRPALSRGKSRTASCTLPQNVPRKSMRISRLHTQDGDDSPYNLASHDCPQIDPCEEEEIVVQDIAMWKDLYRNDGFFEGDARGISLSVSANGVSPFRTNPRYGMWPITVENLARSIRYETSATFLYGVASGPGKPDNLDVCLKPLVDDLIQLGNGVSDPFFKPFGMRNLTHQRRIFNYRLSRARRVVENAFGILASRFRVLLTTLNVLPCNAARVKKACLVLHNVMRDRYPQMQNAELDGDVDGVVVAEFTTHAHLAAMCRHVRRRDSENSPEKLSNVVKNLQIEDQGMEEEEDRRTHEEDRRRHEEDRRRQEEVRRTHEEERRQEEMRRAHEEDTRRQEEVWRRREEEAEEQRRARWPRVHGVRVPPSMQYTPWPFCFFGDWGSPNAERRRRDWTSERRRRDWTSERRQGSTAHHSEKKQMPSQSPNMCTIQEKQ